jgi:hypothetical protein
VYTFRLVSPDVDGHKTRVRASIDSISTPVERKQVSSEPKRWKTRPTSPGNRMEPTYEESSSRNWKWLLLGIALVVLVVIAGKILW